MIKTESTGTESDGNPPRCPDCGAIAGKDPLREGVWLCDDCEQSFQRQSGRAQADGGQIGYTDPMQKGWEKTAGRGLRWIRP